MELKVILVNVLVAVIGYIFGSISWSIILSKGIHKEDIRSFGSGNAGATNTTRKYGSKEGFAVFCLDASKVLLAVIIAWTFRWGNWFDGALDIIVPLAGFMGFIGHIFPVFHKFKGGKGVSAWFGFVLSFNIVLAIILVGVFSFVAFKWKMVSLASVTVPSIIFSISWISWIQTGILTFFFKENTWWIGSFFLILMAAVIILKHIPNIKRIINEQESTISSILSK